MKFRKTLAAIAAASSLTLAAGAQANVGGFLTDLWWNPAESGWGANIVQQEDMSFVTLFLYGPNGEPTWYVAPETRTFALTADGLPAISGPIYKTRGPWFGGPFNPTQVQATRVGEVSVEPLNSRTVRISYRIDGVTVTRDATRQTWRVAREAFASNGYSGAMSLLERVGTNTPRVVQTTGRFAFEVGATQATIRFDEATATCTYTGPVTQSGKFTYVAGAYSCTDGRAGTFSVTDLETTQHGFSGRLSQTLGPATLTGTFGGTRR